MKNSPMDCATAAELFPWYLNGTLAPEEASALEAHLEGCPRCRQEHRETAFAAAAYNTHPEAEALVRFAFHEVKLGPQRSLLEHHLKICPSCSEELRLIEASRDRQHAEEAEDLPLPLTGSGAPLPFRPPPAASAPRWRVGAIAASLVAVLAAGYWLWTLEGPAGSTGSGGPATAGLESPGGKLPGRSAPAFAVVAAEPGTLGVAPSGEALLELEPGTSEVELLLRFEGPVPEGYLELELLDSGQRRLWWGGSLVPAGGNDLRAVLPAEALSAGDLVLRIRRREGGRQVTVGRTPLRLALRSP